jgi:hypothetical protein
MLQVAAERATPSSFVAPDAYVNMHKRRTLIGGIVGFVLLLCDPKVALCAIKEFNQIILHESCMF